MTKVTNKREQGSTLNSVALRMTPIAAGCAILLATASGSTFAQIAPAAKDAPVDTIVVTGIRRGIEAAISVKQNNSAIVDNNNDLPKRRGRDKKYILPKVQRL